MAKKIAFVASEAENARLAREELIAQYGDEDPDAAEVVVALGGDGFMLQTLHRFMNSGKPIYGMNQGTIGFLMNEYRTNGLSDRLARALRNTIRPLHMEVEDADGKVHHAKAINEVSLLRQSYQAASLAIKIDGKKRLETLVCDGVLVATPAGSTAYNLSAHGPILPLDAPLLALTPVSPFRPRRWRGALIPNNAEIVIEVNEPGKRPVNAVADNVEIKSAIRVMIHLEQKLKATILFDPEHSWDDRILAEQFQY